MIRLFGAMYLASFYQYYISSLTLGKKKTTIKTGHERRWAQEHQGPLKMATKTPSAAYLLQSTMQVQVPPSTN